MFRTWKGLALALAVTATVALWAPWAGSSQPRSVHAATEQITLNVDSDPEAGEDFGFTVNSAPAACTLTADEMNFTLDDDQSKVIDCGGTPNGGIFVITITPGAAWILDSGGTTCALNMDDGVWEVSGNTLTINIENDIHVVCTVNFLPSGTATPTATATATATTTPGPGPTTPVTNFPSSQCLGGFPPTAANVTFSWSGAANAAAIFLDLSLFDNNFADGTYQTMALPPGTNQFTWNGLIAGQAHFWRVTVLGTNGDWVTSTFNRFVPCGVAKLLQLSYTCTGGGRATVVFRWAPSSSPGFFQFLDISLFNNGFIPGTFLGAGPLAASQQAVVWPGILANAAHFYRVNTFSIFGWGPTATGSFVAFC